MQDAPDRETILLGLAKFLEKEVRPQLKDPRLGFRALVGAHLAFTAAMESMDEDADVDAELETIRVAMKATLLRKLRVNAPRFDTREDLE